MPMTRKEAREVWEACAIAYAPAMKKGAMGISVVMDHFEVWADERGIPAHGAPAPPARRVEPDEGEQAWRPIDEVVTEKGSRILGTIAGTHRLCYAEYDGFLWMVDWLGEWSDEIRADMPTHFQPLPEPLEGTS